MERESRKFEKDGKVVYAGSWKDLESWVIVQALSEDQEEKNAEEAMKAQGWKELEAVGEG